MPDEREVLQAMFDVEEDLIAGRPGHARDRLRPSFKREKKREGEPLLKSVRQLVESVNDTLRGRLDLEQHGGRTFEGVAVRVAQRVLATAVAIWRNHKTGAPVVRLLSQDPVTPHGMKWSAPPEHGS